MESRIPCGNAGSGPRRCVDAVPLSSTRADLLEALTAVMARLEASGVKGSIWLNGSFVTEKINPLDIDFILVVDASIYNDGTPEQRTVMDGLTDGCDWLPNLCDTNVAYIDPPDRSNSADVLAYWRNRFGYSSDRVVPKGIVVLTIGDERKPE